MSDLHNEKGPVVYSHAATHVMVHATEAEYPTVRAAIEAVAEVITSRASFPCPAVGADGCRWWALVLTGDIDPADIHTAYVAALAANN